MPDEAPHIPLLRSVAHEGRVTALEALHQVVALEHVPGDTTGWEILRRTLAGVVSNLMELSEELDLLAAEDQEVTS